MSISILDSAVRLLEGIFAYEIGSPSFTIVVGICLVTWIVVARIFMAMFSTRRGIVAAFFALIFPFIFGLLGYVLAEMYALPLIEHDWAATFVPWCSFGIFLFISLVVISKRIWDLSAGASVFIYVAATAAAVCAYFAAQVTIGVIEFGEGQVEQRDQRVKGEIESLL